MIEKKKTGIKKKRKSPRKSHSEIEGNETEKPKGGKKEGGKQEKTEIEKNPAGKLRKGKRGRPKRPLDKNEKTEIKCYLRVLGTIQAVAAILNLPVSTLRDRITATPGFSDEIENIRDQASAKVLKAWFDLAIGARIPETKVFQYTEKSENGGDVTKWHKESLIKCFKPDLDAIESFLRFQNLRKNGKFQDVLRAAVDAFDQSVKVEVQPVKNIIYIDDTEPVK